jgi:hypothetical protein
MKKDTQSEANKQLRSSPTESQESPSAEDNYSGDATPDPYIGSSWVLLTQIWDSDGISKWKTWQQKLELPGLR